MTDNILQQQIEYYCARADEYDEWFYRKGRYDRGTEINQRWFNEVAILKRALHQIGDVNDILELASGTGIWTQELLNLGKKITAIDASKEMIAINRSKLNSPKLDYRQLDLFSWQPDTEYDLVFFAFWLSHVPLTLVDAFLMKVYQSIRIGGQLFMIDSRFETTSTANNHILENDENIYKNRKLNDGREFQIVKIFYQPEHLHHKLKKIGLQTNLQTTDNYFIYAHGRKF